MRLWSVVGAVVGVSLVVGLTLVGCSSGQAADTAPFPVTINIKADLSSLSGCLQSPISGTETLVMKDSTGKIVSTETIPFRVGYDPTCDWTVTMTGVPVSDFYTLENGTKPAGPFITLDYEDVSDGKLRLQANFQGVTSVVR